MNKVKGCMCENCGKLYYIDDVTLDTECSGCDYVDFCCCLDCIELDQYYCFECIERGKKLPQNSSV